MLVFVVTSFQAAWFDSVRPIADLMSGNGGKHFAVDEVSLLTVGGNQKPAKRLQNLRGASETNLPRRQSLLQCRLSRRFAHQVVAEQMRPQRLARHGRRLAVDHFHAESLFDGANI